MLAKRALDLVASAAGLAILGLPMLAIAVLVRLDSEGPALFRQTRVGRGGRTFEILKFRTMRQGSSVAGSLTVGDDTRVTRLGASLRKYKIDELPQLINVLKGDMSLVGPRPEVPEFASVYPEQAEVWSVRPGITDPASVALRNESAILAQADDPRAYYIEVLLPEKTALYLDYVRNRTFVGDVRLIIRTIWNVSTDPSAIRQAK